MLIGGQAVLLHGRPRLTEDIDITLGVDPSHLPVVREACTALGLVPLPDRIEEFVRETSVLPVHDIDTRIRVDFIFSTTPYERQAIERAVIVELGGEPVPFASKSLPRFQDASACPNKLNGFVGNTGKQADPQCFTPHNTPSAQAPS